MATEPYRFLGAELHPAQRLLRVDGRDCEIGARAFDLLLALVQRRDAVVTKSELLDLVWPNSVVEENNLQVHVSSLRKVLGARAIATIPGRGYRFVAPLYDEPSERSDATPPAVSRADADSPETRRKTNLPAHHPALLGRADDVSHLVALLASHRLVTVVGAGGIGKSRLAQSVVEAELDRQAWADGVWWIELAGLADAALLAHAVALQLGLSVPEREAGLPVLVDALAPRHMRLVLDNCEHLLDAVAPFVERLLQAAPGVQLLVTSQEPLRVVGEQQYRLEPLAVPSDARVADARTYGAVQLLESRVRAAAPRFELDEADLALAVDLCRRLDGLPLAIELAAARVPLLGLRAVHARLQERFDLLTSGARTASRRQQTLRAAMEWSHALLTDAQRAVFRRLGAFSGGFTMELAQAVCGDAAHDGWAVLEQLAALVDKSLVVAEACEPVRYRLLESPRAFAIEQLANAGETAITMQRHAAALLQFLRQADDGKMDSTLRTHEYEALVLPELDNLRAAYAWAAGEGGDPGVAIGLAAHAGPLIDYSTEFAPWVVAQRAQLSPRVVDAATEARFWRAAAASNMLGTCAIPDLREAARRATDAYRRLARPRRLFSSLRMLGLWSRLAGDADAASAALDEAAALVESDWPAEFHIVVLRYRAAALARAGDLQRAGVLFSESIALAQRAGDWRLEVIDRVNACDLLWQGGRHNEAARQLREIVDTLQRRPASDFEEVEARSMEIGVLAECGRIDEAVAAARAALPVMARMPKFRFEHCAQLLWKLGRAEAAARVLGAQAVLERSGLEAKQVNEERIARATRDALGERLGERELSAQMALGARLRAADVCALLAEAVGDFRSSLSDRESAVRQTPAPRASAS